MEEYRKVESGIEPEVQELFPWIDDKASLEYKQAEGVRQQINLQALTPLHRFVVGTYVQGLKWVAAQKAAKAGKNGNGTPPKKPAVKPPPKSPTAGTAAPSAARANPKAAQAEEAARQRFNSNPTRESVAELIKLGLRG